MWFQPIECDNTVSNPLVCDYSNFEEFNYDEDRFKKGLEIIEWPNNVYFKATQIKYNGIPDDVLQNGFMIPIFSERLKNELEKNSIRGIQYLPARVFDYYGKEFPNYFIANFINYIEAFDFEKSIYNRFNDTFPNLHVRGMIAGVKKFVLKGDKITDCDIIRLVEYNQRFFVSEKFVDIFRLNNFTGYSFVKAETQ